MKKKFLSMVLMLCMIMPLFTNAYAAELWESGTIGENLTWTFDGETLVISGTGEIPKTFSNNKEIKNVIIEDGITKIGEGAFDDCSGLKSITIPNSVTEIGGQAFRFCESLTNIFIPAGVTDIKNGAFVLCKNLTNIEVDEENQYYSSVDGNLFNKDKTELLRFAMGNQNEAYTIPDGVTRIGDNAFSNCYYLPAVTIPESVTEIGDYAFYSCLNLAGVVELRNVTDIGHAAFYGCESLVSVVMPERVNSLGGSAFMNCKSLESIIIPKGITIIDQRTFQSCNKLTSVVISDGVTEIGLYAFKECASLKRITIPKSVTYFGLDAFRGCYNVSDVYYSGTKEEWENIEIRKVYGSEWVYFVNALIHYSDGEGYQTVSTVIYKDETDTEYSFEFEAFATLKNCYAYAVSYDEYGVMINVNCVPIAESRYANISLGKSPDDAVVKVFVFSDTLRPLIDAEEFVIKQPDA